MITEIRKYTDIEVVEGAIRIYGYGEEIVSWTEDEWIEDPSVTCMIVNHILYALLNGPDAYAATIGKYWSDDASAWLYTQKRSW